MKEYRRFVAYVYEYPKRRNCGFIRVEAREQSCRLEAHLLCSGLTPDVKCEVFGSPIFEKADKSAFPEQKADIGIV